MIQKSTDAFPHNWNVEVLLRPPLIAPTRQFVYPQNVPGEEDALARGALYANVRPGAGGTFLATCALGFTDRSLPTGVWSCPNPDHLLAIAGGYGYLIDTTNPETCNFLPLRPVTGALATVPEGLLILAEFHTALAIGPEGVRWQTRRLSWEGVTLREIRDGQLHGDGWDMFADREVPFTIDLRTGEHQGGGYRR